MHKLIVTNPRKLLADYESPESYNPHSALHLFNFGTTKRRYYSPKSSNANNASTLKPTACERRKGGYGTKMMNAIASELPDGVWETSALPDGQVQVTLSWRLP
jgi:hypothetical protein